MLSGDLSTMGLADVLQWADATRAHSLVEVERAEGLRSWLLTHDRQVVAAAPPTPRGILATDGTPERPGPGLVAVTVEGLLDLFLWREGKFALHNYAPGATATPPGPAVPLSMPLPFLVMEALRLLDEQPRLDALYPDDKARLAATDREAPPDLGSLHSAIRRLAEDAPALIEARLVLGLSRAALLRRVDELRAMGLVEVEGIAHGPDIGASLLDQAQILLRERQYTEAAHVFRTLLSSDPGDARARRLLEEAERLEVEAAYELLSPTDVVSLVADPSSLRLTGADHALVDCLSRPRSVSVLVLVSPLREIETLKALRRMLSRGTIAIEAAD